MILDTMDIKLHIIIVVRVLTSSLYILPQMILPSQPEPAYSFVRNGFRKRL